MSAPDELEVQAAERYDRALVPSVFEESARRLADLAEVCPGDRVLDVACGTGVVARECRRRVGDAGKVVGLDVSQAMLRVARRRTPELAWVRGGADSLPFADRAFDRILCQFAMMFFPDPVKAVREMWRVLEPGGALAASISGRLEESPVSEILARLIRRTVGDAGLQAVDDIHALADQTAIRAVFEEAGVEGFDIREAWGWTRSPSITAFVETEIRSWAPLSRLFDEGDLAGLTGAAEEALRFATGPDGTVEFGSPYHLVEARRPER